MKVRFSVTIAWQPSATLAAISGKYRRAPCYMAVGAFLLCASIIKARWPLADQYSETIVDRRLRFAAIPQILGAWNWKQRTESNAKRTRANLANTIPNSIRRAQTNLLHYKAASLYKSHAHFTPLPSERLSGDDKPLKNGLQKFEALNL